MSSSILSSLLCAMLFHLVLYWTILYWNVLFHVVLFFSFFNLSSCHSFPPLSSSLFQSKCSSIPSYSDPHSNSLLITGQRDRHVLPLPRRRLRVSDERILDGTLPAQPAQQHSLPRWDVTDDRCFLHKLQRSLSRDGNIFTWREIERGNYMMHSSFYKWLSSSYFSLLLL